jgi:uncharacterized metal-binding protein YceD (DUF177 family)
VPGHRCFTNLYVAQSLGRGYPQGMKIVVDGIPAGGRQVDVGLRDAWANEAATEALDGPVQRLVGRIQLDRASQKGVVLVDVDVEATSSTPCDRCGEPCERVAHPVCRLLYGPEEKGSAAYDGGEIELQAEDLELGWYARGELDLGSVLREALALELSPRTVCADSAACDRRTDALLSATRSADGPFTGLGGWKPRTGQG